MADPLPIRGGVLEVQSEDGPPFHERQQLQQQQLLRKLVAAPHQQCHLGRSGL
jgi:hypothetical protein